MGRPGVFQVCLHLAVALSGDARRWLREQLPIELGKEHLMPGFRPGIAGEDPLAAAGGREVYIEHRESAELRHPFCPKNSAAKEGGSSPRRLPKIHLLTSNDSRRPTTRKNPLLAPSSAGQANASTGGRHRARPDRSPDPAAGSGKRAIRAGAILRPGSTGRSFPRAGGDSSARH